MLRRYVDALARPQAFIAAHHHGITVGDIANDLDQLPGTDPGLHTYLAGRLALIHHKYRNTTRAQHQCVARYGQHFAQLRHRHRHTQCLANWIALLEQVQTQLKLVGVKVAYRDHCAHHRLLAPRLELTSRRCPRCTNG